MKYLFLLVSLVLIGKLTAKPLPLSYFAKPNAYENVKLSPDGKHLAASMMFNERTVLTITEKDTMKVIFVFQFDEGEHVNQYYWANEERLVITKLKNSQIQEGGFSDGQISAVNLDGSKNMIIFGKNATSARRARNLGSLLAYGRIISLLPEDPKHILISSRSFYDKYDKPMSFFKLNIYTTRRTLIARAPFGNINVVFNSFGEPAFSKGTDKHGKKRMFEYRKGWKEIGEDEELYNFSPISMNADNSKLYLSSHPNGGTEGLYEYNMATKQISKVYQHPSSDFAGFIRDPLDRSIIGVKSMPGKVEYHYFEQKNNFANLHKQLIQAFEGSDITITSSTKDKKKIVILVSSDRNPGDFYHFDTVTKSAEYLLSRKEWLDPALMAKREPIQFKSRDGQLIYGYLTKPLNKEKNYPLVTLVHGGPYGVQDTWWYHSTAQMLANNGYSVLQVNYRGSGGYGFDYETVAHKKRSTLIQEDIIDGTKWAFTQSNIISGKACIMGWSFGGYSAVMSSLIEPNLFKCSIAAAGVYDALEQEEEADYSRVASVASEAEKVYGSDEDLLKKESPLTYIDKLKTPIFIVHGGKDRRVRPEQAYLLKEELDKRGMAYEWLFKKKEGHGFYNEQNREEFFQRSLSFLDKYLN